MGWLESIVADRVDPEHPDPLHRQLAEALRGAIISGDVAPAERFPTEAELQEHFGISRSVVRQALAALSAEGLVRRGRGRGTIVSPVVAQHRSVQRTAGLQTQFAENSVPVSTRVLALGPGEDPMAVARLESSELVAIERVRHVGGEPIAYIRTWLRRADLPGLTSQMLEDASLHETMRTRYGLQVSTGQRQISAMPVDGAIAAALEVPAGSAALLLEGTSRGSDGRPCEYFRTWHRSDRVVFDIDAAESADLAAAPSARHSEGDDESLDEWAGRLARELQALSDALASRPAS